MSRVNLQEDFLFSPDVVVVVVVLVFVCLTVCFKELRRNSQHFGIKICIKNEFVYFIDV